MVASLLYGWSRGVGSSRAIERACVEGGPFRVIARQQRPDHATIARFIERHEHALAGLFGDVLTLCADAGLATVRGDRDRRHQRLGERQPRPHAWYEQIRRAIIIEEAIAHDHSDDDEDVQLQLPDPVGERQGRQVWLRRAAGS